MIVRRLAQSFLLIAGVVAAAPCAAATLLERLEGAWRGKGTIHDVDRSDGERIACRLTARMPEKTGPTRIKGRCSTANAAATFTIEIGPDDAGGLVATIATSAAPERNRYLGREQARSIAFSSQSPIAIKGALYDSSIAIRLHGNDKFGLSHIVSEAHSGAKRTLFAAEFTRRR